MTVDSNSADTQLAVLGAGPAGLLLAAAAGSQGLDVTVVDPSPPGPFPATYGVFEHDLLDTPLAGAVVGRWDSVDVYADQRVRVPLPYVRLDSRHASEALWAHHTGRTVTAKVARVERRGERLQVDFDDGKTLTARRVVDATGHRPVAIERDPAQHRQVAVGATLTGPHGLRRPVLMDFRGSDEFPSFLYAIPEGPQRLFVEETLLITASPPDFSALERRLRERLGSPGSRALRVHERCVFGMDPGPPTFGPVVGFGAAAGLVHPATGYHLGAALKLAAPLAHVLSEGLAHPLDRAAQMAWQVLWPQERRRAHALQRWGGRFVASLGRTDQAAFLAAFFQLPSPTLASYLSPRAPLSDVVTAMAGVFGRLPWRLRWRLALRGLDRPTALARPLLGLQEAP